MNEGFTYTERCQINAKQCMANEAEARAVGDYEHAVKLYRKAQEWRVKAIEGEEHEQE